MVWLRIYSGSGKFCKRCQTSPPHGETQEHLLLCSDLASRRNADNITLEISRIISADLSIDNDIHDAIILRVNDSISSRPVKTDEKVQALLDEINSRVLFVQKPNPNPLTGRCSTRSVALSTLAKGTKLLTLTVDRCYFFIFNFGRY